MKKDWDRDGWIIAYPDYTLPYTFRPTRRDAIAKFLEMWGGGEWRTIKRKTGAKCIKIHLVDGWVNSCPKGEQL